jgi:hypothetical protein
MSNEFASDTVGMPASSPAVEQSSTSPAPELANVDDGPVDIDRPRYAENDLRKSLEPEPPADLLRPGPEAPPPEIDPPRSWNKDARERFAQLPREAQEYIAAREEERDRVVRQAQNEAARAKQEAAAEVEQQLRPQVERFRAAEQLAKLPIEVAEQTRLQETALKEFQSRYSDLGSAEPEHVNQYHQQLLAENPDRAAQFEADVKELATIAEDTANCVSRPGGPAAAASRAAAAS